MLNSCLELEPKHLILQLNYFNDWEVGKRNLKTSDGRLFTQHEDLQSIDKKDFLLKSKNTQLDSIQEVDETEENHISNPTISQNNLLAASKNSLLNMSHNRINEENLNDDNLFLFDLDDLKSQLMFESTRKGLIEHQKSKTKDLMNTKHPFSEQLDSLELIRYKLKETKLNIDENINENNSSGKKEEGSNEEGLNASFSGMKEMDDSFNLAVN